MPRLKKQTDTSASKNVLLPARKSSRTIKPPQKYSTENKYRQLTISSFCTTSYTKKDSNTLQKKLPQQDSNIPNSTAVRTNSQKPIIAKKSTIRKNTFKRNTSGSFEKYGIRLPHLDDILESQQTAAKDKLMIENLTTAISKPLETVQLSFTTPKKPEFILDCKHLTKDELHHSFITNLEYTSGVIQGTIKSKRHELYVRQGHGRNIKNNDLRYNTSMITFTFEQKKNLINWLQKKFGNEKLCENDQYFFNVLLPELCLKIFMDVHNMSKDEAVDYLDERPVDGEFID